MTPAEVSLRACVLIDTGAAGATSFQVRPPTVNLKPWTLSGAASFRMSLIQVASSPPTHTDLPRAKILVSRAKILVSRASILASSCQYPCILPRASIRVQGNPAHTKRPPRRTLQ